MLSSTLIDDGHDLHAQTLRSLKQFIEKTRRRMDRKWIGSTNGIFAVPSWRHASAAGRPPRRTTLPSVAIHGFDMPLRTGEGTVAGGSRCERLGTTGDGRQGRADGTQDGTGSARTSLRGRHHGVWA